MMIRRPEKKAHPYMVARANKTRCDIKLNPLLIESLVN